MSAQAMLFQITVEEEPVTLDNIRAVAKGARYLSIDQNWVKPDDPYKSWSKTLSAGRSYMVGKKTPMHQFIRTHQSRLSAWQKLAYKWCRQNPDKQIILVTKVSSWRVYERGEYVEFRLPYHGQGGEKTYISRDGKTKILVEVD